MVLKWRLVPFETNDAYWNMALDEAILRARNEGLVPSTVRFYSWLPSAVSIGRHQELKTEVDLEAAKKHGVDVVRRITGGGAVFHQSEITYCVVTGEKDHTKLNVETSFQAITGGIARGLELLGLNIDYGQIHCPSLFVKGKKISGNSQYRHKSTILQHGTILTDYDPELMYTLLKVPQGKTKKGIIRSVFQYVTTIKKELKIEVSQKELLEALRTGYEEVIGINFEEAPLTSWEREKAKELREIRYMNEKWHFSL
ncbi:MAG: biotin/lipoate A/B protein ligase family protein [Candidatus Hermodarchaeota archaeon]